MSKIEKIFKNLKRKVTTLAIVMIAVQPVLAVGIMPASTYAATDPTGAPTAVAGPYINAAEETAGFDVAVSLEGTGAEASDTLDLVLNDSLLLTAELTDEDITAGLHTFTVAHGQLGADSVVDSDKVIIARLDDDLVSAPLNLTLDTVAPTVTVTNPIITNDETPELGGVVEDTSADISVTVDGEDYVATNNADNTWTVDETSTLVEQTYDVVVTATDVAGNVGTDTTVDELTIDTHAPDASAEANPKVGNSKTKEVTFTISSTNEPWAGTMALGNKKGKIFNGTKEIGEVFFAPVTGSEYEYIGALKTSMLSKADKNVDLTMKANINDAAGNGKLVKATFRINTLSPEVPTPTVSGHVAPKVKLAVAATDYTPTYYGDGSTLSQEEVKAEKTDDSNDEQKNDEQADVKDKKSVPLWGIIFLLILAGIGGYLFYSQNPKQDGKK